MTSSDLHLDCPLCNPDKEDLAWSNDEMRVVFADEAGYPGFTRVIWHAHRAEMSDLDSSARARIMEVVFAVEQVMRDHLSPDKVNVASLGNQVPHIHWHIIPRFRDDATWPGAVWASPTRVAAERTVDLAGYRAALSTELANSNFTKSA